MLLILEGQPGIQEVGVVVFLGSNFLGCDNALHSVIANLHLGLLLNHPLSDLSQLFLQLLLLLQLLPPILNAHEEGP